MASDPRPACGSRRARSSGSPGSGPTGPPGWSPSGPAATVARGRIDTNPVEPEPGRVAFRPARVNRLLGTTFAPAEQQALLKRVGVASEPAPAATGAAVAGADVAGATTPQRTITVAGLPKPLSVDAGRDETLVAIVPTWRRDIAIEADVAEEVARVAGYETIPGILPHTPMPAWRPSPLAIRDRVRATLAGAGLTETVSHALVSPRLAETFRWTAEVAPVDGGEPALGRPIHVTNPLSADHSVLRPVLVGSLVEIVSTNLRRGREDVAIFEIGKGYGRDGETTREWSRLGLAITGPFEEPSWNRPRRLADLDDAKGVIELVCRVLGIDPPSWAALDGRAAPPSRPRRPRDGAP